MPSTLYHPSPIYRVTHPESTSTFLRRAVSPCQAALQISRRWDLSGVYHVEGFDPPSRSAYDITQDPRGRWQAATLLPTSPLLY